MITTQLHIKTCQCGWNFLAYYEYEKKCPQCKDVYDFCLCCGNPMEKGQRKYCKSCSKMTKKIYDRIFVKNQRQKSRNDIEGMVCNYDCFNCKFSDCILPAEYKEDNETGRLF